MNAPDVVCADADDTHKSVLPLTMHDDALVALERDLELGDADWEYLQSDAWFEVLREDPRFVDLLKRMKALAGEDA